MGRKYANPPVVEAVCEFRMTEDTQWDLTIPGLVYQKVEDEFPRKEQKVFQEARFRANQDGIQQELHTSDRIWFLTEDGKAFLQLGAHLLAVNCLRPYPTWEAFKPRIAKAFDAVIRTVEVKGLQRIGLRYVNRMEIPGESVDLDDYLRFRPFLDKQLPQRMDYFRLECLLALPGARDTCRLVLTNAKAERPGHVALLLDIDYFLAQPQAVPVGEGLAWVDSAHAQVERIFEGCISDKLRELFQERA